MFTPTDLQRTRLQQAITETRRYPGWAVIKQFITAEAAKGIEGDIAGLNQFIVRLFHEALGTEAEYATKRVKTEGHVASD